MKHVFISYQHEDSDFAYVLIQRVQEAGLPVWIDQLQAGTDWREEIEYAIEQSSALIVIMSPAAKASEYVTYEWAFAWGAGIKVIPVVYKQIPLHPRLETLDYFDFTNPPTRPWKKLLNLLLPKTDPITPINPTFRSDKLLTVPENSRINAFISYSHKDKRYLEELHIHLAHYIRTERLNIWDDTKLQVGSNWREEIKFAIQAAKIAIFLISADFLASDFIASNELPPLLAAAKKEGAIIICVILRPSAFKDTELAQFQTVNILSRPLSKMAPASREEIWNKVSEIVRDALRPQQF